MVSFATKGSRDKVISAGGECGTDHPLEYGDRNTWG